MLPFARVHGFGFVLYYSYRAFGQLEEKIKKMKKLMHLVAGVISLLTCLKALMKALLLYKTDLG